MAIGKKELALIEGLLTIDYQIYDVLKKIKEAEEKGILDDFLLEQLKNLINEEDKIINLIASRAETLEEIINYLFYRDDAPTNEISIKDYQESVLNNDIDKLVKKRVFNKLQSCYLKKEDTSDFSLEAFEDYPELANQTLKSLKAIYYFLHLDYANAVLTILNEYLAKEKSAKLRASLYQIKYNYAFLFPKIEQDLLEHQMAINPHPKENYFQVSKDYNLDQYSQKELRNAETDEVFNAAFLNLIRIVKNNIDSLEEIPEYLINFIFGRACLSFLSLEELQNYQKSIRISVVPTSMEYAQKNQDKNRLLSERINNMMGKLFSYYEIDRKIFSADERKIN